MDGWMDGWTDGYLLQFRSNEVIPHNRKADEVVVTLRKFEDMETFSCDLFFWILFSVKALTLL